MPQKNQSFKATKEKYESLRSQVRESSYNSLPINLINKHKNLINKSSINLKGLDLSTQIELSKWELDSARKVGWSWVKVRDTYKYHPKRFELSIWNNKTQLCGASIGKPTRAGDKLRLDYVESAPQGTELDGLITDINLLVLNLYAKAINANQVRIMNPVNEDIRDYYLSKPGFNYNSEGNFCYKNL